MTTNIDRAADAVSPYVGDTSDAVVIADCIASLAKALTDQRLTGSLAQTNVDNAIIDLLTTPFNRSRQALEALLVPDPDTVDTGTFGSYVASAASQLATAARNPFEALIAGNLNVVTASLTQIGDQFYNPEDPESARLGNELRSAMQSIGRQLLLDPLNELTNLGGLIYYAISESIPALETELALLQRMRRHAALLVDEAGRLPPSMVPGLPLADAIEQLCRAEGELKRIQYKLIGEQVFEKAGFSRASTLVEGARDVLFSGELSEAFVSSLEAAYPLAPEQLSALRTGTFLPNPQYRLETIRLTKLNARIQRADYPVQRLHGNLQAFLLEVDGLVELHLADILAVLVDVIRRQVRVIRTQLEATSAGYSISADLLPKKASQFSAKDFQGATQPDSSVLGLTSSIAASYTYLAALVFIMQRVLAIHRRVQQLLDLNSEANQRIKRLLIQFRGSDCPSNRADALNRSVQRLVKACEQRLAGTVRTNDVIAAEYRRLRKNIDEHEQFLRCFQGELNKFLSVLGLDTSIIASAMHLASLAQTNLDIYNQLRTADISALLKSDGKPVSVWDEIVKSLQCLTLQCDNPFVSSTAAFAAEQAAIQKRLAQSYNFRVEQLSDTPAASAKAGNNRRLQAGLDVIQALQQLTSLDLSKLCSSTEPPPVTPTVLVQTPATGAAPQTVRARDDLEDAQGRVAAGQRVPLAPG